MLRLLHAKVIIKSYPTCLCSLRMEKIIANGWKGAGILSVVYECRNMNWESLPDPFAALSF